MESYVFSESLNTDENWNAAQIAIHPQENKLVVRYKNFFKFNFMFTSETFEEFLPNFADE